MPATNPGAQIPRKKPVFNEEQTRQIAAYITSLGGGPAIPSADQVDPAHGDSALGGELFRANCAQCHNFAGSGGALTGGKYAPPLDKATPTQIYEAMITGPQAMPVFNDTTVTPEQKRAIIAYVTQTRARAQPRRQRPRPRRPGRRRHRRLARRDRTHGRRGRMWLTAKKPKKKTTE